MRRWLPHILLFLTLLFLGLYLPSSLQASHLSGVDITTSCINSCTLRVTARYIRDCTGSTVITDALSFQAHGDCPLPTPIQSAWTAISTTDITPVCPGVPTGCSQPGSSINGFEEYLLYRDYDICLSMGCQFTMTWIGCCRYPTILQSINYQTVLTETELDLSIGCNNGPVFTHAPVMYIPAGKTGHYDDGAYDPDGDSLSYSLIACQSQAALPSTMYPAGFTPTTPLGATWSVSLNPRTGLLSITPQPGNFVVGIVCIAVDEWRNGFHIGRTVRDHVITVLATPTINATPTISPVSNLTGPAYMPFPDVIEMAMGGTICFDLQATSPDTAIGRTLAFYHTTTLSGTSFTELGNPTVQDTIFGNAPTAHFCWTAPLTPGFYRVTFITEDDACLIHTTTEKVILINVRGAIPQDGLITGAGALDFCAGIPDTLYAPPGFSSYQWSNGPTTPINIVTAPGLYGLSVSAPGGYALVDTYTVSGINTTIISGNISDHLGMPLSNQRVWLILHDQGNQSLHAIDSTFTDATGFYGFCAASYDTLFVKAAPNHIDYPNDLPTYADTALFWANARPLYATNFPLTLNFWTRFGANPGGTGFISGLISQGANKNLGPGDPVPALPVILYNVTLGQPMRHTVSDANGRIAFYFLPPGDYRIMADKPGIDLLNVPTITLTASNAFFPDLDFRLHSTYLELVWPLANAPGYPTTFEVQASPNPFEQHTLLTLQLPSPAQASAQLIDLQGRSVWTLPPRELPQGKHQFELSAPQLGLKSGIYLLRVQAGPEQRTLKLLLR